MRRSTLIASWTTAWMLIGSPALADESSASARYTRGRSLLEKHHASEALIDLEASFSERPSPNSKLLVAHAQRELGRNAAAHASYRQARTLAAHAIASGETRYQETESEAAHWEATLELSLARLTVRAPRGASAHLSDGTLVELRGSGDRIAGELWLDPQRVLVFIDAPSQPRAERWIDLAPGKTATVELDGSKEDRSSGRGAAPAADLQAKKGPVIAPSVIAGSAAALFLSLGIGFSVAASHRYHELGALCPIGRGGSTPCPATYRNKAEAGGRDQTVGNVMFVAAGAGALTSGLLGLVFNLPGHHPRDQRNGLAIGQGVAGSPLGANVELRF